MYLFILTSKGVFLLFLRVDELIKHLERFVSFGNTYWRLVFDREDVKDEIIRLITIEQLYEQGIDETGSVIQPEGYAPSTIEYKKATGQRFDHVTLNDSNDFYNSFVVFVGPDYFTISANDDKGETQLFDVYGEGIIGLTEDSREALIEFVFDTIRNELEKIL